jgi:anthraniloyl-CoA monooxygenase
MNKAPVKHGDAMRIVCIGGGPAGLYFAILMKLRDPAHRVSMIERNGADDTFGWGVVFSDETLRNLKGGDPETEQRISVNFAHWDDINIHFKGRLIRSGGHGFCGIERKHLLNILQDRATDLGVELVFQREVKDVTEFADADLMVAADGINSTIRTRYTDHFQPSVDVRTNRFAWLGTHKLFDAFTFIFVETEWGWFHAHAHALGGAAHTAHFSIGSGAKLALEDAIGLAQSIDRSDADIPAALAAYEAERRVEVQARSNFCRPCPGPKRASCNAACFASRLLLFKPDRCGQNGARP